MFVIKRSEMICSSLITLRGTNRCHFTWKQFRADKSHENIETQNSVPFQEKMFDTFLKDKLRHPSLGSLFPVHSHQVTTREDLHSD